MTHKTVLDVPDGMQKIYRRFERWRTGVNTDESSPKPFPVGV